MRIKALALSLFIFVLPVVKLYAAADAPSEIGDVIGHYYTTDIVADVDGMAIPSYNIGGVTVIEAEALDDYGFAVIWDENARIVLISTLPLPETTPPVAHRKGKPGKVMGNVLHTDIMVNVNGCYTQSFNIGGKTVIPIEELARSTGEHWREKNYNAGLGYSNGGFRAVWNAEKRTISLQCLRPGLALETPYGTAVVERMVGDWHKGAADDIPAVVIWPGIDGGDQDSAYFFDMDAVRKMTDALVAVRDGTLHIDSADAGARHSVPRPSGTVSVGNNYNPLLRFDAIINGENAFLYGFVLEDSLFVSFPALRDALNIGSVI
ncbi:MAG: hypothetical protein LBS51_02665 [Oscillospiraceae bacterium]|jgi:hypothetical protein|nr:hypothetical protein [Oscillospiraceae bacterium]